MVATTFRRLPNYARFTFTAADMQVLPSGECIKLAGSLIEAQSGRFCDWGIIGDLDVDFLGLAEAATPVSREARGRAAILGHLTSSVRMANVHHSHEQLWRAYRCAMRLPRRCSFNATMDRLHDEKLVCCVNGARSRIVAEYRTVAPSILYVLAGNGRGEEVATGYHREPNDVRITGPGIVAAIGYGVCKI